MAFCNEFNEARSVEGTFLDLNMCLMLVRAVGVRGWLEDVPV